MNIEIIGAGPAGLACAYGLAKKGIGTCVHESSGAVGGMARSIQLWGQAVDIGPHRFFSSDPRVNALWLEVAGADYVMVQRLTRIFYRSRFLQYPLRPVDALTKLGLWEAVRCVTSYTKERFSPTPQDGTFESWVCSRFGRRLFSRFFKTYSEKLWGIQEECRITKTGLVPCGRKVALAGASAG